VTTLIREDRFSPYLRTGGYLFRPVPTRRVIEHHEKIDEGPLSLEQPDGRWALRFVRPTAHVVGTKVRARHLNGTTYATVAGELWISHGASAHWDEETHRSLWNDSTDCYQG
jgi:hypothetical protein